MYWISPTVDNFTRRTAKENPIKGKAVSAPPKISNASTPVPHAEKKPPCPWLSTHSNISSAGANR
jgi:hypothetical protein